MTSENLFLVIGVPTVLTSTCKCLHEILFSICHWLVGLVAGQGHSSSCLCFPECLLKWSGPELASFQGLAKFTSLTLVLSVSGFSMQWALKGPVYWKGLCVFFSSVHKEEISFPMFSALMRYNFLIFPIVQERLAAALSCCFAKWYADYCFRSFLRFVTISAVILPEI